MNESSPGTKRVLRRNPTRRPTWVRLAGMFLLAGLFLGVSMLGITWWAEGPLRTAGSLLDADAPADALNVIDEFLKSHRDHTGAVALKARALSRLGRAAESVQLFDQVGAASKDEMKDCVRAYLMLGQWTQAREVLEYLVTLDPDDADRYHELAACRAKLGEYDRAVEAATIFASKPGKESRGYLLVGLLESDRGNAGKAVEAWKKVLQLNPNATDLQVPPDEFFAEFGSALIEIGEPEKARESLTQSIAIKETSRGLAKLGSVLLQLAKPDDAIAAWEKTLTLEPTNEIAILGLAELALRSSDFKAALDRLKPLEESNEPSSGAAFLLSRVHRMAGDADLASVWKNRFETIRRKEELKKTVDQILVENPSSAWGQILQSYRLAESGNIDQARKIGRAHV